MTLLIHGDSFAVIKCMPDKSVQSIVTSVP